MGLLLRIMTSYFSSGRYVIVDSGFFVLKGLIHLSKKGIFACYIINKRRYLPSMVLGKDIKGNFGEVDVEETDCIQGKFYDVIKNL